MKTFATRSGVSQRQSIDSNSYQSVGDALTDMFHTHYNLGNPIPDVLFSLVKYEDNPVTIRIGLAEGASPSLTAKAQRFLSVVAGASGDFKADVNESELFAIHAPLQQWAMGIQKMHGTLSREKSHGAAL